MSSRLRLAWADLPTQVRREIEARLGSAVVEVRSHEGGYSPGMAATLTTADGAATFVKAVSSSYHQRSSELYRDEARINGLLPDAAPAPRMRWSLDDGEWVAVAFEAADSEVALPWDERTLNEVLDTYAVLARVPGPPTLPSAPHELAQLSSWHTSVRDGSDLSSWDPWVTENLGELAALSDRFWERTSGTSLVHLDARRDNMVRLDGRVLLVDWAYAAVGAPWLDLLLQLPSVTVEGGAHPWEVWERAEVAAGVDADDVTAVLAGLAGYFVHGSVQPPPPGIPHVRAFQRAQGEVALAWLRQRLGAR